MISKTINSLGYDLVIQVPETIHEYDTLAKKVGAALESAIMNVVYRGVNNKFRAAFALAVENNTGIERATVTVMKADGSGPKLDDDGEPITKYAKEVDTEGKYLDLVFATLVAQKLDENGEETSTPFESVEAAAAAFAPLAQSIIAGDGTENNPGIAFDPTEKERVPGGPKKVAKAYIKLAEDAKAKGKLESLAQQLQDKLGALWKVEATVESVARAVSEDQRRKREKESLSQEYAV